MQCALPTPFVFLVSLSLTARFQNSLKTRIKLHSIAYKMFKNCGGGEWRKGEGCENWGEERHGCWGERRPCIWKYSIHRMGVGGRGTCTQKKFGKKVFGQLIRKMWTFSGKYHVKFRHFVHFLYIYVRAKLSCPSKLTELLRLCLTIYNDKLVLRLLSQDTRVNEQLYWLI